MITMRLLLVLTAITTVVIAATSPPAGAVVAKAGDNLQALVDANAGKTIFLQPGKYSGPVKITKKVTMIGYSEGDSYNGNKATITINRAQESGFNNDQTAAVQVHADGAKFYNINFENTWGLKKDANGKDLKNQALAVSTMGDEIAFYGCKFDGWQDTIETEGKDAKANGKQFFGKCLIQGCTDFIFGKSAIAWFEDCEIRVKNKPSGYITAQGRDNGNDKAQYVFNDCNVDGSAPPGAYYLGRPWRPFAQVTFQNSKLSAVINRTGWSTWNTAPSTSVAYYEYKNTGPGASTARGNGGKQASGPKLINSVMGSTSWIDPKYLK